jgi:PPOX class probable F420-dependent enzyme
MAQMTPGEVSAMLAGGRKAQLATINPDGTPHLVTMFYAMRHDRLAFWTYRASRKARNLARDPRLTCLVEDGEDYFSLRGVQLTGRADRIDEPARVAQIGHLIAAGLPNVPTELLDDYIAQAAHKRAAYLVDPSRVVSWDHRKLLVT